MALLVRAELPPNAVDCIVEVLLALDRTPGDFCHDVGGADFLGLAIRWWWSRAAEACVSVSETERESIVE